MHLRRLGVVLAAAALLGGCGALNTLRVERARDVGETARPALAKVGQVLETVADTSREASIEIAVADRSCDWPELRLATAPQATGFCAKAGEEGVPFAILDPGDFAPTLRLLDALSSYVDAVGAIAAEEPYDVAAALTDANADLTQLVGDLGQLEGRPRPELLTDQQFVAVKRLATLVARLAAERDQVARLRVVEADAGDVRELIATLRADVRRWTALGLESDLASLATAQARVWQRQRLQGPPMGDPERRALLRARGDTTERLAAARALPGETERLLDALARGHADYRNALLDRELNERNRREEARIAAARFRETVLAITATLAAFAS